MRFFILGYVALGASLVMAGCHAAALSPERASVLAAPYVDSFLSFERWSVRAIRARPAFHSRAALGETLFAPLRRDALICGAWIETGEGGLSLTDQSVPGALLWTRVRNRDAGEFDVAIRPMAHTGAFRPCVFVRRTPGPARMRSLTVAFALQETQP